MIPFHWSSEADSAFRSLKERFIIAAIFVQPDADLQFIVEVAASDYGEGAILSQRSDPEGKLH